MDSEDDDEGTEMINVRVPASLAEAIKRVYKERGFTSKSEFVRSAIRNALNPPQELSDDVLEDIEESQSQIDQNETKTLSEVMSQIGESTDPNDSPTQSASDVDVMRSFMSAIPEEASSSRGAPTEWTTTESHSAPDILAIGCGGAGNNTIDRLQRIRSQSVRTLAINTDKQHLEQIEADTKILIGGDLTNGLGAGGDPSVGERAAELSRDTIRELVAHVDLVFVTAGMGGGTGTGATPVVAEIAREQGAIVVGLISTPFNIERARTNKAKDGIEQVVDQADTTIIQDYNKLLDYSPGLPIGKAFSVMDQILAETINGISETLTQPSLINFDYADLSTILKDNEIGTLLIGEVSKTNNPANAVDDAFAHSLLDVEYQDATGGLVFISGGPDLTLEDAESIVEEIYTRLSSNTTLIWGARSQEGVDTIQVTTLLTGFEIPIIERTPNGETEILGQKEGSDVEFITNDSRSYSRRQ